MSYIHWIVETRASHHSFNKRHPAAWLDTDQLTIGFQKVLLMASPTHAYAMAAGPQHSRGVNESCISGSASPNFISLRSLSRSQRHLAKWNHVSSVWPKETQTWAAVGLSGLRGSLKRENTQKTLLPVPISTICVPWIRLMLAVFLWPRELHDTLITRLKTDHGDTFIWRNLLKMAKTFYTHMWFLRHIDMEVFWFFFQI